MKNIILLTGVLFVYSFLSSCNKYLGPPDSFTNDADVQKFIDSARITDPGEKVSINYFVKQLKDSSLWAKFIAIYPMVGSLESTTKFNLKDPRDADDAYRLSFYGSPVFAHSGILFPTASDYADTHLSDKSIGSGYINSSISYYSVTQNDISGYDMGCNHGTAPYNELSIYSNSGDKSGWFGFRQNFASPVTTGLFMLSSDKTDVTQYRNGDIVKLNGSVPKESYTNFTILIGKSRGSVNTGKKECALATIGFGLTDAEALSFYRIVQNFEDGLSR